MQAPIHSEGGAAALAAGTAFTAPEPTPTAERIESIDVLRGFILLGILFMNIPLFGLPHWVGENPVIAGGVEGLDWWAGMISVVLFDGKMRALFSMLFGAGAYLLTRRAEAAGSEGKARSADIYYRRMLWLMAFGIFDGYVLGWYGDILYWYGLAGLVLFPLRKLRPRTLIIAAICMLLVGIGMRIVRHEMRTERFAKVTAVRAEVAAGHELDKDQKATLEEWDERLKEFTPPPEVIQKEVKARRGGYASAIVATAPVFTQWSSEALFLDTDVLPMLIMGLGLARAGVITGQRSTRFYALLAGTCLPVGVWIASMEPLAYSRAGFSPEFITPYASGGAWSYATQRIILAIGYMSVVMLASRRGVVRPVLGAIAACGRMPLTNYLAQSVVCLLIFTGAGLGLLGEFSRWQLLVLAVAIWVPQVVLSALWLRWFAFGPMEWLWRWLAYRARPKWKAR